MEVGIALKSKQNKAVSKLKKKIQSAASEKEDENYPDKTRKTMPWKTLMQDKDGDKCRTSCDV